MDEFSVADAAEAARHGKIKMGVVEGRGGKPMTLPIQRQDGLGTTVVVVTQTTTDADLQRRFKHLANSSRSDNSAYKPHFGHEYDIHTCPLCRGRLFVKERGVDIQCPKCKGAGIITLGEPNQR